jgi:hypothetical protein
MALLHLPTPGNSTTRTKSHFRIPKPTPLIHQHAWLVKCCTITEQIVTGVTGQIGLVCTGQGVGAEIGVRVGLVCTGQGVSAEIGILRCGAVSNVDVGCVVRGK